MYNKYNFDSDSFQIGIYNHASRTISNNIKRFVSEITPTRNTYLRGVEGNLKVKGGGTLVLKTNDDHGKVHDLIVKNILCIPLLPSCILSPQHEVQQAQENTPKLRGTWCATYGDACTMHWGQRWFNRTVPYDSRTNTSKKFLHQVAKLIDDS